MTDMTEVPAPVDDPAALAGEIHDAAPMESIRLLIGEARAAAASELELAKACGTIVGASVKAISIWGVVALITLFVAVLCLAIGLMIALATVTGPWWASAIVPGALLLVTLIAGLRIRSAANHAKAAVARLSA